MTAYTFRWPKRVIEHKLSRDTRGFAQHLRGRCVVRNGCWYMSVVNTATGETVCSDNGCVGLARAFEDAEFYTAVARAVWMRGITHKSVQRKVRVAA